MTRKNAEPLVVAAMTAAVLAPFWGKPYHIDEPFFLAIARHILRDPWHPLAFPFNWYGRLVPMETINNTPPLLARLLALDWLVTGGKERAMRALLLPLDLSAALSLYWLAARFLKRPLWPTLAVIATPAFAVNMNHLMAEKLMAAFAFPALYALVRGVDDRDDRWYWGSGVLFGLALLSKYNAVFLALPMAGYALRRGVPFRKVLAHLALAAAGLTLCLLPDWLHGGQSVRAAWRVTSSSLWWSAWSHRLRAFFSFVGGCAGAATLWPLLERRRMALLSICAAAAAVLFLPSFDLAPIVGPIDRATGLIWTALSLYGLLRLFGERTARGRELWVPWTLSVALLQVGVYWSVMARFVLFLIPPFVFAAAARLEESIPSKRLTAIYAASLAATLGVTTALSIVDLHYARAQKDVALRVGRQFGSERVWCLAHWGLQYYLENLGAHEMDFAAGGWDLIKPGDVIVSAHANAQPAPAHRKVPARFWKETVEEAIPLRLISGWSGEGAFYSSVMGFLPYSISREPLEEYYFAQPLESPALTAP